MQVIGIRNFNLRIRDVGQKGPLDSALGPRYIITSEAQSVGNTSKLLSVNKYVKIEVLVRLYTSTPTLV